MHDSTCRWLIVENPKIFQSYVERNCRILTGLSEQVFVSYPMMFLKRQKKLSAMTQMISEKRSFYKDVAKILQGIWETFSHENNFHNNSYKFSFKLADMPSFSLCTKPKTRMKFSAR